MNTEISCEASRDVVRCYCLWSDLYCLALWLRRLGAGLAERAAAGSATCRSVFWRRAPSSCSASGVAAGPLAAEEAEAERMPTQTLARRARTRPTEFRARLPLSAPPPTQPLAAHQLARKNQISRRWPYPFKPNESPRGFSLHSTCNHRACSWSVMMTRIRSDQVHDQRIVRGMMRERVGGHWHRVRQQGHAEVNRELWSWTTVYAIVADFTLVDYTPTQ